MRFCSGARVLDRALVVADAVAGASSSERLLLDVDVTAAGVEPLPGSWRTAAMADADTLDVAFHDVPVTDGDLVGEPGWYVDRPGFALGGAGVAAVWWGGTAGVLDRVLGHLCPVPDAHQLAHITNCTQLSPRRTPCWGGPPRPSTPIRRGTTVSPSAPSERRRNGRHARWSTAHPGSSVQGR
jgi:hypothetical protein